MRGTIGKRTTIAVAALATAIAGTIGSMAAVRARDASPQGSTATATAPAATAAPPTPSPSGCVPVTAAAQRAAAALPGHVDSLSVGGHAVLVYVPGAGAA